MGEKYDKMVDGVDSCVNFVSTQEGGRQVVKSTYDISVLHMKFKYFMKHTYDPGGRGMVFHLDYDKRSDIDDSVGYWYVLPTGRAASRVFYSCECKLRGWVPAPVYSLMTKEALKKALTFSSAHQPSPPPSPPPSTPCVHPTTGWCQSKAPSSSDGTRMLAMTPIAMAPPRRDDWSALCLHWVRVRVSSAQMAGPPLVCTGLGLRFRIRVSSAPVVGPPSICTSRTRTKS